MSFIHTGLQPEKNLAEKFFKYMLPTCYELPYVNDAHNVIQITFYED